jgi:hypothetical protein
MALHPAEGRGYRELYFAGKAAVRQLTGIAPAYEGSSAETALVDAAATITEMLTELRPITARHDLYSQFAAEGVGAGAGIARSGRDRFLERNQALRFAADDLGHLIGLVSYLGVVSETRGNDDLAGFCDAWEPRLRGRLEGVRTATRELGADPDLAVRPLDGSLLGRAAHGVGWVAGTIGEWTDRQVGRRR